MVKINLIPNFIKTLPPKAQEKVKNLPSSPPVQSTPTPQTQATPQRTPFFSKQGQKEAVERVVDVFTLKPAAIVNPVTNTAYSNRVVAGVVQSLTAVSEVGSALYGGALLAGAGGATATTATTATATGASASSLKTLGLVGLGGFAAGSLFSGGGSQASTAPQTVAQSPTLTANPQQDTAGTIYDYSIKTTKQDQIFNIRDSPGASIVGTQSATLPGNTLTQTPTQYANPTQNTTADQQQSASTGINWQVIAIIAVGFFAVNKLLR